MSERRDTLKIIGSVGATCAFPFGADSLYAQHEHSHGGVAKLPDPSYFAKDDFAILAAVAEHIVPGAGSAGVPVFIDFVVSRNKAQQKIFSDGLKWLQRAGFASISKEAQLALLRPVCDAVDRGQVKSVPEKFFRAAKSLTADGFWTSRAGMAETLGFKGAAILASYPECKEH